ncbi:hypothetical protein INT44_005135, partial [Umbelopsis vinacea]
MVGFQASSNSVSVTNKHAFKSLDTMPTAAKNRKRQKSGQAKEPIPEPSIPDEELRKVYASNRNSRMIIFGICLLFRIGIASITQTYDNPDEYWQAQEVAHRLAFGYPFLTIEPNFVGLDNTGFFVTAPRYLESVLAAVADYFTYRLAKKTVGETIAPTVLFCTLVSFFNFHMAARTLSNSLEMVLTVIALNYWPIDGTVDYTSGTWIRDFRVSLAWAALACIIRPTNALIWAFLGLHLMFKARSHISAIIANTAAIFLAAVALSTIVDTWCYDGHLGNLFSEPVFTPGKFFELNVVSAISIFYGVHSWHWYLSQGIPVVLVCLLPTFLFGWYQIGKDQVLNDRVRSLKYVTTWTVAVYSLLSHKEFRFIYPIVPIMHIFAAYGLSQLPPRWRKWAVLTTMAVNISMGVYTTTTHQRGVIDAVNYIRTEAQELNRLYTDYDMEVAFLMPCHSTPWQSVIHDKNVDAWFLTCEPPLKTSSKNYLDEADKFYANPSLFITERVLPTSKSSPDYVVVFDSLLEMPDQGGNGTVGNLLQNQGHYVE